MPISRSRQLRETIQKLVGTLRQKVCWKFSESSSMSITRTITTFATYKPHLWTYFSSIQCPGSCPWNKDSQNMNPTFDGRSQKMSVILSNSPFFLLIKTQQAISRTVNATYKLSQSESGPKIESFLAHIPKEKIHFWVRFYQRSKSRTQDGWRGKIELMCYAVTIQRCMCLDFSYQNRNRRIQLTSFLKKDAEI